MLNVAAYTGGRCVPSARFRVRQYGPSLAGMGIRLREYFPTFSSYPPQGLGRRMLWAPATLADRVACAPMSFLADVTLIQREMMSTLLTAERLTRRPRVLDVDDAIFLHRDGRTARRLAQMCDLVICGNGYLAEAFSRWNGNVELLATAVDTSRFHPSPTPAGGSPRIGWSGTSSGFPYLYAIAPALARALDRHPAARLTVVADRPPRIPGIASNRVDFVPWSEQTEVRALQSLSIGLMPLEDTPWSRGKCSFKLLTYMACGIPAVASPVGMNREVLRAGGGLPARTEVDWFDAINYLLSDPAGADRIGRMGPPAVEAHYSVAALAPRLGELLRRCA